MITLSFKTIWYSNKFNSKNILTFQTQRNKEKCSRQKSSVKIQKTKISLTKNLEWIKKTVKQLRGLKQVGKKLMLGNQGMIKKQIILTNYRQLNKISLQGL